MRWVFPATTSQYWWLDETDFGEIVEPFQARIAYDPLRTAERVELGYGYGEHFIHGGGQKVRISYELGENEDLADQHIAFLSVLREGAHVSFSNYTADTWAVPMADPDRGETLLTYSDVSQFSAYDGISNPVPGARCIIQSALPQLRREIIEIDSVDTGGQTVTVSGRGSHTGLVYNYTRTTDADLYAILRPMTFFPFLRLIPGQRSILRQENGMAWIFDAWFMVDVGKEHEVIGTVLVG